MSFSNESKSIQAVYLVYSNDYYQIGFRITIEQLVCCSAIIFSVSCFILNVFIFVIFRYVAPHYKHKLAFQLLFFCSLFVTFTNLASNRNDDIFKSKRHRYWCVAIAIEFISSLCHSFSYISKHLPFSCSFSMVFRSRFFLYSLLFSIRFFFFSFSSISFNIQYIFVFWLTQFQWSVTCFHALLR